MPCNMLPPTNCDLRISIKTDKHSGVTRLAAVALVEKLQLHLHKDQIADIAWLQDQYTVWTLRNQYAVLRPTGWRSFNDTTVSPRQVRCIGESWHYTMLLCLSLQLLCPYNALPASMPMRDSFFLHPLKVTYNGDVVLNVPVLLCSISMLF